MGCSTMEDIPNRNGDPFVSLVSRTVVNQFAFANNCGVPLGLLVNCVSAEDAPAPEATHAPLRCRHCGAYMNVWCTVGIASMVGKWKCCFCSYVNEGPANLDTSFTELRYDAVQYTQDPVTQPASITQDPFSPSRMAPPASNSVALAESNPITLPAPSTPSVSSPSNGSPFPLPSSPLGVTFPAASTPPSSTFPTASAPPAATFPAASTPPATTLPAASSPMYTPPSPHITLLFDTSLDDLSMRGAQAAASGLLRVLPPSTRISILIYGASVAVFDLSAETASACVLPGQTSPTEAQLKQALEGVSRPAAPLSECSSSALTVLSSLRPHSYSVPSKERKRCMGCAAEVALHLIKWHARYFGTQLRSNNEPRCGQYQQQQQRHAQGAEWHADRILIMAGGTPTFGPGTLPVDMVDTHTASSEDAATWKKGMAYFKSLGQRAASHGVTVDVFASRTTNFNVPLCLELVHSSGGEFMLHRQFGPLFQQELQAAVDRQFGRNAMLDLYVSRDLRVAQVLGSVSPLSARLRAKYSSNACSVSTMETGRGLGVCLEVLKDLTVECIFMQVVLIWTNPNGQHVTRVVTNCLRVVGTAKEFISSVDPHVAGTLLAKKLILEGHKAGAALDQRKMEELRLSCGAQLAHMARRFGTVKVQKRGFLGWGTKQVFLWPAPLLPLASILYHLQRSPLLLPQLCSIATRMLLAKVLLRSAYSAAEHMVQPRLHEYSTHSRSFQEIPPVTLALSSTKILLLDCGHTFFLWFGSQALSSPEYTTQNVATPGIPKAIRHSSPPELPHSSIQSTTTPHVPQKLASPDALTNVLVDFEDFTQLLAAGRFPVPDVHMVHEGEDDMWPLALRLVPVHLDGEAEQQKQYPHLGELSMLEELRGAGREQCGTSFVGWCLEQGVEVLS